MYPRKYNCCNIVHQPCQNCRQYQHPTFSHGLGLLSLKLDYSKFYSAKNACTRVRDNKEGDMGICGVAVLMFF